MKLEDFSFRIWNNQTELFEIFDGEEGSVVFEKGDEIELWSGITDSKNRKIFEGDRIEASFRDENNVITDIKGTVVFRECIFMIDLDEDNDVKPYLRYCFNIKILGNVHRKECV